MYRDRETIDRLFRKFAPAFVAKVFLICGDKLDSLRAVKKVADCRLWPQLEMRKQFGRESTDTWGGWWGRWQMSSKWANGAHSTWKAEVWGQKFHALSETNKRKGVESCWRPLRRPWRTSPSFRFLWWKILAIEEFQNRKNDRGIALDLRSVSRNGGPVARKAHPAKIMMFALSQITERRRWYSRIQESRSTCNSISRTFSRAISLRDPICALEKNRMCSSKTGHLLRKLELCRNGVEATRLPLWIAEGWPTSSPDVNPSDYNAWFGEDGMLFQTQQLASF